MQEGISQKVIRNTIWNTIGQFWGSIVTLVLTPYIIGHIGIERYGIWAIVGVLTGYFGLLDFGISSSFVKYIAEYYTTKEYERINQVVNTGLVFYSILGVLLIILGFWLIGPLLVLFKIPKQLYDEARFVFLLGIILFCVSNALSSFFMIREGLQRMDISNKVTIVLSVPTVIGIIFFLEGGYGLPGLMVNQAIILGLNSLINFIIAFKILPQLRFNPLLYCNKEMFKILFRFGYKLQLAKIFFMITISIDKVLISYFLSVGMVTFYQLGSGLVEKIKAILLLPVPVLLPAFSELDALKEKNKLSEGYSRGVKYLGLLAIPVFVFIILSASSIMMVWMGPGYEKSALVIQILAIGHLGLTLAAGFGNPVLRGMGKPEYEMRANLINVLINLPLSILFISKFGFMGAAIGTMIAWLVASLYYFVKTQQEIQLPIRNFIRLTFLKPLTICLVIGLSIWGLTSWSQQFLPLSTRMAGLVILVSQMILFFGSYIAALIYVKPLDNMDSIILSHLKPYFIRRLIMSFALKRRETYGQIC